mgnify:CR=1 FL=1
MGWLAALRRRLLPHSHLRRDDDLACLFVTPLEQRRVLDVTSVSVVADLVIDEGSSADVLIKIEGTYVDSEGASNGPHSAEVRWDDGTTESFAVHPPTGNVGDFSAEHSYYAADEGIYHPTVTVRGKDGTEATSDPATATITVRNVAPALTVVGDQSIGVGVTLSITDIGTFTDPGYTDTFEYSIDWGDGTATDTGVPDVDTSGGPGTPAGGSFDGSHVYAADGVYTVAVTITDRDGGEDTKTFDVTVGDTAPALTVVNDQVTTEGTELSLSPLGTFTAPAVGNPYYTYEIDWGDGTTIETGSATIDSPGSPGTSTTGWFGGAHTYADDGSYTVTATIHDGQGGSDTETFLVTVDNLAPTITSFTISDAVINEDGSVTVTGSFTDPGTLDVHTVLIDWGLGEATSAATVTPSPGGGGTFTATHQYLDDNPTGTTSDNYVITATVTDDDGASHSAVVTLTVDNVAPTITSFTISDAVINEDGSVTVTGSFTDPGTLDTHTVLIDWGLGEATSAATVTPSPGGGGTFTATHQYLDDNPTGTTSDNYVITATVTDDDGASDSAVVTLTVDNVAPAVDAGGNVALDEGGLFTRSGTFTDPGTDTWTAAVDYGDGSETQPLTLDSGKTFDLSHVYADNGVYTVTVTVWDDDGGIGSKSFTVTVDNVVPAVGGVTGQETVDEGSAFTLAELGWVIQDPGFDNPAGGTSETFTTTYMIDWGDGTPAESGAILNRVSGSYGVPTVAEFEALPHTYADNGIYTVQITFGDDDSAPVTHSLQIVVANVAPTVTPATEQTIDEGALLTVEDIATFTDPGFDNPDRPGGASVETFTYEIDWGDGSSVHTGDATVDLDGSAGVATAGSFDGSHVYADNGVYTVALTVTDDDGGTTVATTQVIVLNVAPILLHFDDSEVNTLGQVTVEGSFCDPGFDNPLNPLSPPDGSRESFTVVIDWADGTHETILLGGPGPFYFTAMHTYDGPPDPLNPANDIRIEVTVTDDDRGSDVAETYAEVPGEGVEYVYIDTTPKVPRLVFPRPLKLDSGDLGAGSNQFVLTSAEFDSARPDSTATSENYVVLRTVLPDGSESADYRLPDNALSVLPDILSRLPDNRYRVYEIQSDGPERLVRDVFVRQGRVIDQTDVSEGMEERPPQSQSTDPDTAAPEPDQGAHRSLDAEWEQWEARHAAPVDVAEQPAGAAPDAVPDDRPPIAATPAPHGAVSASAAGTALLAFRLRADRSGPADRVRERFAAWRVSPGKESHHYPQKPR